MISFQECTWSIRFVVLSQPNLCNQLRFHGRQDKRVKIGDIPEVSEVEPYSRRLGKCDQKIKKYDYEAVVNWNYENVENHQWPNEKTLIQ